MTFELVSRLLMLVFTVCNVGTAFATFDQSSSTDFGSEESE